MAIYTNLHGLQNFLAKARGDERVHIGIRPYGFHAGNVTPFVIYPNLMCKFFKKTRGDEPRFTFVYSINDYEQDSLDGPDYRRYPFNVHPRFTNIGNTYADDSPTERAVDYWQGIIERIVRHFFSPYAGVNIEFHRNSSLKSHPNFKRAILETIRNPRAQLEVYRKYSHKEVLEEPATYAGAICPGCASAIGTTAVLTDDTIAYSCNSCKKESESTYEEFEYWFHHKPLMAARIGILDLDVLLSGGDHFGEGDDVLRGKILELLLPEFALPDMIFTPTIISPINNFRMSKSRKNSVFCDIPRFIEILEQSCEREVMLPTELIVDLPPQEYTQRMCGV